MFFGQEPPTDRRGKGKLIPGQIAEALLPEKAIHFLCEKNISCFGHLLCFIVLII